MSTKSFYGIGQGSFYGGGMYGNGQPSVGFIEKTIGSVSIASFNDGLKNKPLKECVVDIDPVQDLHGYDAPWSAGGGRNKFDTSAVENTNQYISKINGQETSPTNTTIWRSSDYIPVTPGDSLFFGEVYTSASTAGTAFYNASKVYVSGISATELDNASGIIMVPEGAAYMRHSFRIDEGYNTNWENTVYIVSNSAPHEWTPYSNICPIIGWTGAKVTRCGKNLFDVAHASIYGRYIKVVSASEAIWRQSTDSASYAFSVFPNTTYHVKLYSTSSVFRVGVMSTNPEEVGSAEVSLSAHYSDTTMTYCTIQTGANDRWMVIQLTKAVTEGREAFVQVEMDGEYSSYSPYIGTTYPILWQIEAGTVYGGTLDVTNGTLTVGRAMIANYAGETLPSGWISDRDAYALGMVPTTGAQVVYELATPATYQLTPQQITTLLGMNNIWADTGDITIKYLAKK